MFRKASRAEQCPVWPLSWVDAYTLRGEDKSTGFLVLFTESVNLLIYILLYSSLSNQLIFCLCKEKGKENVSWGKGPRLCDTLHLHNFNLAMLVPPIRWSNLRNWPRIPQSTQSRYPWGRLAGLYKQPF